MEARHQALCSAQPLHTAGCLALHGIFVQQRVAQLLVQLCAVRLHGLHATLHLPELQLGALRGLVGHPDLLHQRGHLGVDLVVGDDVHHPVGEVSSCDAFALHRLEVEEGQSYESVCVCQHLLWDFFSIKGFHIIDKLLRRLHHLLAALPVKLSLLLLEQEAAGGHHVDAFMGRLWESLQLLDGGLVQTVHSCRGLLHGRQGIVQLVVRLHLHPLRLCGQSLTFPLLLARCLPFDRSSGGCHSHLLDELLGGDFLLVHLD
mmetsp:Transcript_44309/g.105480  ORF Transcript_44309/g.105480 Transcript_44309/m.105480 type:complete len:260 (+) Transcript_44309:3768-4547(+)